MNDRSLYERAHRYIVIGISCTVIPIIGGFHGQVCLVARCFDAKTSTVCILLIAIGGGQEFRCMFRLK